MAEEEPKAPAKKSSVLSGKFHGVPKPVIAVGGGVALYLVYKWYRNRSTSSTPTTGASAVSPTDTTGLSSTPTDTGSGGGYGGFGSGSALGGGGGAIDPLTGMPYQPGVGSLAPATPTTSTTGSPVGTTIANGAVVMNPGGGTDQAAVDALEKAKVALSKALASGNAKAIKNATDNLQRAQATVDARNAAAVSSAIPGGGQVDPITYATQVAQTASGVGKGKATGTSALVGSNGNAGAVAPKTPGVVMNAKGGNDQAAVNALNEANAARQRAIRSGNQTALKRATANVKRAQAVVASRNRAAK
ncbi:MAG: hypothetical protein ACYC56_14740 [Candidatus Aquicultor sp.]